MTTELNNVNITRNNYNDNRPYYANTTSTNNDFCRCILSKIISCVTLFTAGAIWLLGWYILIFHWEIFGGEYNIRGFLSSGIILMFGMVGYGVYVKVIERLFNVDTNYPVSNFKANIFLFVFAIGIYIDCIFIYKYIPLNTNLTPGNYYIWNPVYKMVEIILSIETCVFAIIIMIKLSKFIWIFSQGSDIRRKVSAHILRVLIVTTTVIIIYFDLIPLKDSPTTFNNEIKGIIITRVVTYASICLQMISSYMPDLCFALPPSPYDDQSAKKIIVILTFISYICSFIIYEYIDKIPMTKDNSFFCTWYLVLSLPQIIIFSILFGVFILILTFKYIIHYYNIRKARNVVYPEQE